MEPSAEGEIGRAAELNDPLRRALYRLVRERGEVSRDEAARALDKARALAATHLDRLVACGLLEATFRRPSGRGGPGAGRPTKYYRWANSEVEVSIPPRRYELAARLLAVAIEQAASPETLTALEETARSFGEMLGAETRLGVQPAADEERILDSLQTVLTAYGYEPQRDRAGSIRLRNCPFRDLVCGMNLELCRGLVGALDVPALRAELTPEPGMCCVTLHLPGSDAAEPPSPSCIE